MIDPHNRPVLGTDGLRLRAPIAGDVEARLALGSHAEILHMFGADPANVRPLEGHMAQSWVDYHLQEPLAFMIVHDGRLIGDIRLHSMNDHDRRAALAVGLLDPDLLGQGIGTQAMRLILEYGFATLGLNRVTLRVVDYNARAIAAYKKLGFKHEGRERQSARVGETYHDDIIMGLLASEWPS
jgi:RimJ/RimL family protein N-acetyltransferase